MLLEKKFILDGSRVGVVSWWASEAHMEKKSLNGM